jgi:hypothetical protein
VISILFVVLAALLALLVAFTLRIRAWSLAKRGRSGEV